MTTPTPQPSEGATPDKMNPVEVTFMDIVAEKLQLKRDLTRALSDLAEAKGEIERLRKALEAFPTSGISDVGESPTWVLIEDWDKWMEFRFAALNPQQEETK